MGERDIEIGFGTLFEVFGEENRTDVVINVGKKGWFSTAELRTTEDGKKMFFLAGTAGKENVSKIVGQMSPEDVIKAAEEGAKRMGIVELPKVMRDTLKKYSRSKPRII